MTLLILIGILLAGGLLAWLSGLTGKNAPKFIALFSLAGSLALACGLLFTDNAGGSRWLQEFHTEWIPQFGISLHLALDGLSLLMIILTLLMGLISMYLSWNMTGQRTGFYYFNLLLIIAGFTGAMLALDLFLFYFFWELMLIPMFLLIAGYGNANKERAAYKFFLFTQAGGLLMLASILSLYFIRGAETGVFSFDYMHLMGIAAPLHVSLLIMAGFLAAFFVKMPVVPFHNWLPDVYAEAPAALIPAGLLVKAGAYGILRFVIPLFPEASAYFAPAGMAFGIVGILYGAKLAFAQTDFRRLIAYMSISHAGFIIFGIFALNETAYHGVVMQMLIHALSTAALFIMAFILNRNTATYDISRMGGIWAQAPVMGAVTLIFVLASLGLPGTGNFTGEFLTLAGAFRFHIPLSLIASLAMIVAAIYALRIMQKVFFGEASSTNTVSELGLKEKVIAGIVICMIFLSGFFPKPITDTAAPALQNILKSFEDKPAGDIQNNSVSPVFDSEKNRSTDTQTEQGSENRN